MAEYKSFTEYLKSLKYIPRNNAKNRIIDRSTRCNRRDEMRNTNRHFSPEPPTPFKPNVHSTMIQREMTPAVPEGRSTRGAASDAQVERMAKLKKWREKRDKKIATEKANRKPLFKSAVHNDQPCAAPLPVLANNNHKFKAPANIKPIFFNNAQKSAMKEVRGSTKTAKAKLVPIAPVPTRKVEMIIDKPTLPLRRKLNFPAESEKNQLDKNQKNEKTTKTKLKDTKTKVDLPPRVTRQTKSQENFSKTNVKIESKPKQQAKTKEVKTTQKVEVKEAEPVKKVQKEKLQKKTRKVLRYSDIEELPENKTEIQNELLNNKENISQVNDAISKAEEKISSEKTPRRKSQRTLSQSNHEPIVETTEQCLEEKTTRKSTRFKTPTKTPKTPSKTPKVKSRKSAGRTPRKSLRNINFNEDDEDDNVLKTPDENRSRSIVYPCNELDSTFTLDEPSVAMPGSSEEKVLKTPEERGDAPVYVSPFVTMSRGKKSARSEYKSRASKGGECAISPESTNVKAAAAYFYKILDDEIARIQGLCEKWEEYKVSENLPEEACNMINVPVGQSNLLISKKMQQFRALIDKSVNSTDGLSVTCTDLHGFWDTVMIQVSNLDQRFENLNKLRDNHWLEVLPAKVLEQESDAFPKPRRILPQRAAKKKKVTTANSRIRDAIKAARANRNQALMPVATDGAEFNGGFFSIKSPVMKPVEPRASPRRTPRRETTSSLLKTVLHSESRKSVRGSPGLAMIKASQQARNSDRGDLAEFTPKKSILKVSTPRSSVKKVVFFKEAEADVRVYDEDECEATA